MPRLTYEPLPSLTPRASDEQLITYGARVLQFLLACSVTATLSDEDLELADHVAVSAVAARDVSPLALRHISETRHVIAQILRGRRAQADIATAARATWQDKPNIGPMAPLEDAPIVRPPAPAHARVDIQF